MGKGQSFDEQIGALLAKFCIFNFSWLK